MKIDRTITTKELSSLGACKEVLKRFRLQTHSSEEAVTIASLIGGKNTTGDFIWLADALYPRKKLVQFAVNCANLVAHLNPDSTIQLAINATKAWIEAPTKENEQAAGIAARAAAAASTRATTHLQAYVARAATAAAACAAFGAATAANSAAREARAAANAHSEDFGREIEDKINELLKGLFKE